MTDEDEDARAKNRAAWNASGVPEPGIYELSKDVKNPKPDRRTTRDWRAIPVWEKGTRFLILEDRELGYPRLTRLGSYHHEDVSLLQSRSLRESKTFTILEELVPALVRVPGPEAEMRFWFERTCYGDSFAYDALEKLFVEGKIDIAWLSAFEAELNHKYNGHLEEKEI